MDEQKWGTLAGMSAPGSIASESSTRRRHESPDLELEEGELRDDLRGCRGGLSSKRKAKSSTDRDSGETRGAEAEDAPQKRSRSPVSRPRRHTFVVSAVAVDTVERLRKSSSASGGRSATDGTSEEGDDKGRSSEE